MALIHYWPFESNTRDSVGDGSDAGGSISMVAGSPARGGHVKSTFRSQIRISLYLLIFIAEATPPIGVLILERLMSIGVQECRMMDMPLDIANNMVIQIYAQYQKQILLFILYLKTQKKPLEFGIMLRFTAMEILIFALSMKN